MALQYMLLRGRNVPSFRNFVLVERIGLNTPLHQSACEEMLQDSWVDGLQAFTLGYPLEGVWSLPAISNLFAVPLHFAGWPATSAGRSAHCSQHLGLVAKRD
jgi:hypothetical protein